MARHILAIHKNEMTTVANGDGTKTTIDMQSGATYLMRGNKLLSLTSPCCEKPDIHWREVGARWFSFGAVSENLHDVCECRTCGKVLYDESVQLDREIKF